MRGRSSFAAEPLEKARFNAQVTEWLMVADCKSAALRSYGGSNPPLCTRLRRFEGVSKALAEREAFSRNPEHKRGILF
jgi:hypothetical protein